MLNSTDIEALRSLVRQACPSTVTLLRPTSTPIPGGGVDTGGQSTIGSDACQISPDLPSRAMVGDQERTNADAVVRLPGDTTLTDIRRSDRMQVEGVTYEVQGHAVQEDPWTISKRVLVSRV